jgi:glutathione S-transferase
MLRIWGRQSSINVQKVMWTLAELGLAHERVDAGGRFGGLDTPAYAAMNPNRLIPVIDDGGVVLWESNAIVRYLAARYGTGGLWPADPAERAGADMWAEWIGTTIMPHLGVAFWQLVRTPEADRDHAAVARAAQAMGPLWQRLDDHLGDRRFVAGDRLTIGDIPAGCAFYRYVSLAIDRPSLPNLQLWYQNLKARDPYREHVMIPVT